jgi:hypothetical protein
MGSPISPVIANCFLCDKRKCTNILEHVLIKNLPQICMFIFFIKCQMHASRKQTLSIPVSKFASIYIYIYIYIGYVEPQHDENI